MINTKKLLAAFSLTCIVAMPAAAKMKIAASLPDLASIASYVGGGEIEVFSIAKANSNPHFVEVLPSYMIRVSRVDLYLKAGLALDQWADPIIEGSRNNKLTVVDCSAGIEVLEKPTGKVDASLGDVHPQGNPHYWLDPANGIRVAENIRDALKQADPSHAALYDENVAKFEAEAGKRIQTWREKMAPLNGSAVIIYHSSWVYFTHAFGLNIVGHVEPFPGIPPTARHLQELVAVIKSNKARLLIQEPYYQAKDPEFLTRETGIKVLRFTPSCEGLGPDDYLKHFDVIVDALSNGGQTMMILHYPFVLSALALCLMLTGIHSFFGHHVVRRGVIFVDLALAQVAALGSSVGILMGWGEESPLKNFLLSLAFTLIGALLFSWFRTRKRAPIEALIGITYASALAFSLIILEKSATGAEELKEMLVGSILTVTRTELAMAAGLYSIIGLLLWLARRPLFSITEDADAAAARGLRLWWWDFLFYAAFGITVTFSVKAAGVLLVFVFLTVPALTSILAVKKTRSRIAFGWVFGALGCILGLEASLRLDWSAGPAIVAVFIVLMVLSGMVFRRVADGKG